MHRGPGSRSVYARAALALVLAALPVAACAPSTRPVPAPASAMREDRAPRGGIASRSASVAPAGDVVDPFATAAPAGDVVDPFATAAPPGDVADPFATTAPTGDVVDPVVTTAATDEQPSSLPAPPPPADSADATASLDDAADDGLADVSAACQRELAITSACAARPETSDGQLLAKAECFGADVGSAISLYSDPFWFVSGGGALRIPPDEPSLACAAAAGTAAVQIDAEQRRIEDVRRRVLASADRSAAREGARRAVCKVLRQIPDLRALIKGRDVQMRKLNRYARASWARTRVELQTFLARLSREVLPANQQRFRRLWKRAVVPRRDCADPPTR